MHCYLLEQFSWYKAPVLLEGILEPYSLENRFKSTVFSQHLLGSRGKFVKPWLRELLLRHSGSVGV